MKTFEQLLIELNACYSAKVFVGSKSIETSLKMCERGDWILWLAKKLGLPLNKLTLAKARSAKTVIHLMKEKRSMNAVHGAEAFGLDKATREELDLARKNAYAAATYAANTYAADAATYACATDDADAAATYAYAAATYAAYATYACAADARRENQKLTAKICKKILGGLIIKEVNIRLGK